MYGLSARLLAELYDSIARSRKQELVVPEPLTLQIFCECTGGVERRAPSLADLGNEDIPKERRSPLQVRHASQLEAIMLPFLSVKSLL